LYLIAGKGYPANKKGIQHIVGSVLVKECIELTKTVTGRCNKTFFDTHRAQHGWMGSFESACIGARAPQHPPPYESRPNTNPISGLDPSVDPTMQIRGQAAKVFYMPTC